MTGTILIRPVGEDEREAWNPLWADYLSFYKTALAQDVTDLAWTRFHDPDETMFALGGYVDGKLAGFAHYLFHRSTWAPKRYCYLEDLFVADGARGYRYRVVSHDRHISSPVPSIPKASPAAPAP